jgi:hypothetical protein
MYLTRNLVKNKKGAEMIAAAFTDRLPILLSNALETNNSREMCSKTEDSITLRRGIKPMIQTERNKRRQAQHRYGNMIACWDLRVKNGFPSQKKYLINMDTKKFMKGFTVNIFTKY